MATFLTGTGNVYADLGHPDPEAALAKAVQCARLCDAVGESGLGERAAAALLGLPPAAIAGLTRGAFAGHTAAQIARMADRLTALTRTP